LSCSSIFSVRFRDTSIAPSCGCHFAGTETKHRHNRSRFIALGEERLPLFAYVALAENGATLTGETVAASEDALRSELLGKGLLVRQVRARRVRWDLRRVRVRPEEFALFNQEFMALVRAGLTVPDALALASERPDNPALGAILVRVREDVGNGVALSEACARHPEAFDRLYLAALRTGEKTGDFAAVLSRYQDYLRHRVKLRRKIGQALAYPVFLLLALAVILAVLFVFVMPRFAAMYADMGAALPLPTRVLLSIVDHLYIIGPALAALGLLAAWGWRAWLSTDSGRRQLGRLQERMPYVGEVARISTCAQLARSLATLLAGGTPLVEALRTAASSISNRLYLDRLEACTRRVTEGSSLAQAVRSSGLMPPMATRLIEVGEASGGLDSMLAEVAQFYEEVLDIRLARVMALVEPLLMLLMGVVVGGIIIVMYLPVFNMADVLK
jgi:type IV pilus assembly protein PilC